MKHTLQHTEESSKGLFEMMDGLTVVGRMTYSRMDAHNIIVDHTVVDPQFKGLGLGRKLVDHLVEWARLNEQKVLPLCTFAKKTFMENPEIQDVLRK
ncbi:MAG: GNAT family N-acetyltransferase [Flavobacteriales bacterium]